MKILLTGANGYIGKQLLTRLVKENHEVICCVRQAKNLDLPGNILDKISIVEIDFSQPFDTELLPITIDIAYFLIHGVYSSNPHFEDNEQAIAQRFRTYLDIVQAKQVIYLSRICNSECLPPIHKASLHVEQELQKGNYKLTILRAGLIIGKGSTSFEILRKLVNRSPIIFTSRWVNSKCEPISIKNVLDFLIGVMDKKSCYDQQYDIGGSQAISYKQMIETYAEQFDTPKRIINIPFFSPQVASFLLRITTSTNSILTNHLIYSLIDDLVCEQNNLAKELTIELSDFKEAIKDAINS
jgi:uncharacterized protein YbjT (DUF2867 family)